MAVTNDEVNTKLNNEKMQDTEDKELITIHPTEQSRENMLTAIQRQKQIISDLRDKTTAIEQYKKQCISEQNVLLTLLRKCQRERDVFWNELINAYHEMQFFKQ